MRKLRNEDDNSAGSGQENKVDSKDPVTNAGENAETANSTQEKEKVEDTETVPA